MYTTKYIVKNKPMIFIGKIIVLLVTEVFDYFFMKGPFTVGVLLLGQRT